MKFYVKEKEQYFDNCEEAVDACIEDDYHDKYDDYFEDWVNDVYGSFDVAGNTYSAYDILDHFGDLYDVEDEYKESENDSDRENAKYECRNADVGEEIICQNYTIVAVEDDAATNDEDDAHPVDTGDTDGDDVIVEDRLVEENKTDCIEMTRRYYNEQQCLLKQKQEEEEKTENDLMKMFQVITA